jgi:YidC/Oxa1 family membrane protein insertase
LAEIQNPNQQGGGGGMDSRSLIGFFIAFVVMMVAFEVFAPKKPQAPAEHPQQKTETAAGTTPASPSGSPESATTNAATPARQGKAPAKAAAPAENAIEAAGPETTVVENELYRITFSNRGGDVTSWVLKKYTGEDGKPLDLVNQAAAAKFGLPLSLYTYDAGLREKLNSALYVPSGTGTMTAPGTLSFTYSAGGLTVHKTYHFESGYVIQADISVTQNGAPVTALLAWPSGFGDQSTAPQYANSSFDESLNGKTDEVAAKKVVGGATLQGPIDYAGPADLYFAAIFIPQNPGDSSVVTLNNELAIPKDPQHPVKGETESVPVLGAAVGENGGVLHTAVFVGPKVTDLLASIHTANGGDLSHVVDYGWWTWIAKPMLLVLRFFVNHGVNNWGWSILILTFILNIAMLPTRFMMMKTSLRMQRLQPQMDAIKAKYAKYKATDPRRQEMNKEIFDLQRANGVNMFGGCLPMLLQYPLLIGFYEMLEKAIELRHAHWLWMSDLSTPDPTRILPIFVIVSMFLSQFFTPSPGMDQKQQRMMAFMMPVFFGFIMWNLGSGVCLYWAGSNLIGVGQQMIINRTSMGREMRAIAAKRAAKKAGKTINARR